MIFPSIRLGLSRRLFDPLFLRDRDAEGYILIVVKCQGECVEAGPTFRVEQLALPVASSGAAFMF